MELLMAPLVFAVIIWVVFGFLNACRSIDNTTKAIGEWNKKQLRNQHESSRASRHSRRR